MSTVLLCISGQLLVIMILSVLETQAAEDTGILIGAQSAGGTRWVQQHLCREWTGNVLVYDSQNVTLYLFGLLSKS